MYPVRGGVHREAAPYRRAQSAWIRLDNANAPAFAAIVLNPRRLHLQLTAVAPAASRSRALPPQQHLLSNADLLRRLPLNFFACSFGVLSEAANRIAAGGDEGKQQGKRERQDGGFV